MLQANRLPSARTPSEPGKTEAKILLVDVRNGIPVEQHPEVVPWHLEGWRVRNTEPRVVEQKGAQLLVVLERETEPSPPAPSAISRPGKVKT